jgi:hypothetical protein
MKAPGISQRFCSACLIALIAISGSAQQVPVLTKKAQEVKRVADTLTPQSRISVIPNLGDEEFGQFLSSDQETFTFHHVDLKTDVTFRYADVRKLKRGYAGYNYANGRHVDRRREIVAIVAVVAALGGLLAALASAKN